MCLSVHILLLAESWEQPGLSQEGSCQGAAGLELALLFALCTLAESTALPQPGGQQDLDTRDVKSWQEEMLLFSWARPSPHLQLISVFHLFPGLEQM